MVKLYAVQIQVINKRMRKTTKNISKISLLVIRIINVAFTLFVGFMLFWGAHYFFLRGAWDRIISGEAVNIVDEILLIIIIFVVYLVTTAVKKYIRRGVLDQLIQKVNKQNVELVYNNWSVSAANKIHKKWGGTMKDQQNDKNILREFAVFINKIINIAVYGGRKDMVMFRAFTLFTVIVMLGALFDVSRDYYKFLHIVTFVTGGLLAYKVFPINTIMVVFISAVMILYNPIFPIYLYEKSLWILANIITVGIFVKTIRMIEGGTADAKKKTSGKIFRDYVGDPTLEKYLDALGETLPITLTGVEMACRREKKKHEKGSSKWKEIDEACRYLKEYLSNS